jgi:ABC-type dipeptide/oligopeptide/nickel transport system permease subunit
VAGVDPFTSDFLHGVDPTNELPLGPSAHHWLGTDRIFRDVFARLAAGARFSLLIGFAATAIAVSIGTIVGLIAGWFEGERVFKVVDIDSLLMRGVDVGLSFPFLLLVMAISAAVNRTTVTTILLLLGLTSWLGRKTPHPDRGELLLNPAQMHAAASSTST